MASQDKQEFGWHSTAEDIARGHDLTEKVALVTGGNSGIGLETARVLALHGCRVIITSRKADAAEAAIQRMKSQNDKVHKEGIPAAGELSYVTLDLADLDTIKTGVESILQQTTSLNYVILNAGVMACPYTKTKNGLEMQIGTNHFGHFALTKQLLAGLTESPERVVVLSSLGHRLGNVELDDLHFSKGRQYDPWVAYGQSKMANILYAKELQDRGQGAYTAVSVHPGFIVTNLGRHIPAAKKAMMLVIRMIPPLWQWMWSGNKEKSVGQGAATTLWATLKDGVKGGEYCSDCAVEEPVNNQAQDLELQKKLWDVTEQQLAYIFSKGIWEE